MRKRENIMDIASTIKKLRKSSNMTQEELAEKLSVTHQAVSNWERSKTQPDIETLKKMSEIFNVSIEEILYGKKIEEGDGGMNNNIHISSGAAKTAKAGISFGSCLAMIISYAAWKSIPWAVLHGLMSWFYVIYYAAKYLN